MWLNPTINPNLQLGAVQGGGDAAREGGQAMNAGTKRSCGSAGPRNQHLGVGSPKRQRGPI